MDGGFAVIGAVVGALLLGLGALLRQRAASRRRLLRPEDGTERGGPPPGRPGRSPAQEVQGAPPDTDAARRGP